MHTCASLYPILMPRIKSVMSGERTNPLRAPWISDGWPEPCERKWYDAYSRTKSPRREFLLSRRS
jgi:hypothetical protein